VILADKEYVIVHGRSSGHGLVRIEMALREQHMVTHLVGQGRRLIFDPDRVVVETEAGGPLSQRANPGSSFEGYVFETAY
jgi:hypothetical protein